MSPASYMPPFGLHKISGAWQRASLNKELYDILAYLKMARCEWKQYLAPRLLRLYLNPSTPLLVRDSVTNTEVNLLASTDFI
jgi:hypothetical protein